MQNWVNFFNIIFWLCFLGILINSENFLKLIFFSEFTWVALYIISVLLSGFTDDLVLMTLSFFILGLAGLELSIGYVLVIVFNFFNKSTSLNNNNFSKLENNFNINVKRYASFN